MFCRFLEFYLVSASHAGCAIRIFATNIVVRIAFNREWGTWLCVRDRRTSVPEGISGRIRLDGRLRKAAEVTDLPDRSGRIGVAHAAGHDPGRRRLSRVRRRSTCRRFKTTVANANENSPLVAVDPIDPAEDRVGLGQQRHPGYLVHAVHSGLRRGRLLDRRRQELDAFLFLGNNEAVPVSIRTHHPTVPYEYQQITNPSLDFDRNGNFYVLMEEHNSGQQRRARPAKVQLRGRVARRPAIQAADGSWRPTYNIVDQWLPTGDLAIAPTMAVDDNVPSFTDPTTGEVQTDLSSGTSTSPGPERSCSRRPSYRLFPARFITPARSC